MMKGLRLFAVISALTLQSISSFTPVRGLQQINQIKKPSPHFSTHLFARHFNDNDFREPTISNFDKMKSLKSRLSFIEKTSPATIAGFYEPHLKSFSVRPGSVQIFSVTSTLFSLQTLMSSTVFDTVANMQIYSPTSSAPMVKKKLISLTAIFNATLMAEWREDDLFQVPLLIDTLLKSDPDRILMSPKLMDEELANRLRTLISALLNARPQRRSGEYQPLSEYLLFLCAQAMATLAKSTPPMFRSPADRNDPDLDQNDYNTISVGGLPLKALPVGASSQLSLALSRSSEVSFNELCRQLAYRSAGDRSNFDIMRLVYSLLTYITSKNALYGTAGRELIPGKGPEPGTKSGPPNKPLVKAALDAFFEEQNDDGMWDKGQPIYKSFRKTGRNIGNAFVYAADTLGSLLDALPAEDFRPHINALEKMLTWIESHQEVEYIADYCDPESLQCYGKPLKGWASPHLAPGTGPQAWSTAQTITCVTRMRKVVGELMHNDVLLEFGGIHHLGVPSYSSWDRLLDADLGVGSLANKTLKQVLEERMITPFDGDDMIPSYGACYSTILFGPPGTAKTTICEALAERMGWDFVVIDTAAFLADGLTNVASRIRYVFERLMALDKCVILFDEIEEFCLDRENPGLGMESRMLTTAMLTAINDLRREKKSIFFLATNRLRAFDSAITRPGRFDMQLFVGTPNLDARCVLFSQNLDAMSLDKEERASIENRYRKFLESVWTEEAMFMNYLEGVQYANACADFLRNGDLTEEVMASILSAQSVVITIRGSARDEFVSSMGLSRL